MAWYIIGGIVILAIVAVVAFAAMAIKVIANHRCPGGE